MTVVFDQSTLLAGSDDGGDDTSTCMVVRVTAGLLGAATGDQIKATFLFGTATTGTIGNIWIDNAYAGLAATSGDAFDFAATPVQLKFSGGDSILCSGTGAVEVTSDWATLPEAYDETKDYCIAFHVSGTDSGQSGAGVHFSRNYLTDCYSFYRQGTTSAETAVVDKSGYATASRGLNFLEKIEIQSSAPPPVVLTLGDRVLTNGLAALSDEADAIYICSAAPASYAEATGSKAVGYKNFGTGNCFGDPTGWTSGREVVSTAIVDGTITADSAGGATCWAAVTTGTSRLLAFGPLNDGQPLTNGETFTLDSFAVRTANP